MRENLSYETPELKDISVFCTWTNEPIVAHGASGGMEKEGEWDDPFE